ncbi:MAG: sensor histidine kinase, partial [Solirubrobacteraceae bacterium]
SYVEALADGVLAADAENWGAIRSETARLNRLVNDLQRVSRAEAHQLDLHRAPTDPGELVQDAVKAAGPAFATKRVALASEIETNLPMVEVDRERIAEVLANLLTNALRHTAAGGTVQASVRQRSDRIEIAVADDGEGIAAEHLDRVFERFYRVDPARARASGGTGIGLAIVRAIVEAHDGSVTASSEGGGRGATFTIRLPISPSRAPDEGQARQRAHRAS